MPCKVHFNTYLSTFIQWRVCLITKWPHLNCCCLKTRIMSHLHVSSSVRQFHLVFSLTSHLMSSGCHCICPGWSNRHLKSAIRVITSHPRHLRMSLFSNDSRFTFPAQLHSTLINTESKMMRWQMHAVLPFVYLYGCYSW